MVFLWYVLDRLCTHDGIDIILAHVHLIGIKLLFQKHHLPEKISSQTSEIVSRFLLLSTLYHLSNSWLYLSGTITYT